MKHPDLISDNFPHLSWRIKGGQEVVELETEAAGMPCRVIRPPVDTMRAREEIDADQHSAATRLRRDYELGVCGARDPEAVSSPDGGNIITARSIATQACQRAMAAIDVDTRGLIRGLVLEECAVSQMARQMYGYRNARRDAQVLQTVIRGLGQLVEHYKEADKASVRVRKTA